MQVPIEDILIDALSHSVAHLSTDSKYPWLDIPSTNESISKFTVASLLSTVSLLVVIVAIVTTMLALYMIFTSPKRMNKTKNDVKQSIIDVPGGTWVSFMYPDFKSFLSSLLLSDEIAVIDTMAGLFLEKGVMTDLEKLVDNPEKGWRNKHRIASESGVTQRRVYSRGGIIDRLVALELVEMRDSDSSWGRQKHLYRLNITNDFVREYLRAYGETLVVP